MAEDQQNNVESYLAKEKKKSESRRVLSRLTTSLLDALREAATVRDQLRDVREDLRGSPEAIGIGRLVDCLVIDEALDILEESPIPQIVVRARQGPPCETLVFLGPELVHREASATAIEARERAVRYVLEQQWTDSAHKICFE